MMLIVGEEGNIINSYPEKESKRETIAASIAQLAMKARSVVRDLNPLNDLTFFRVRAKNREIMVAPSQEHLFLIVVQTINDEG
ncbi:MAG: roadblock/LC7 domain-containing protein [bacterium]